MSLASPLRRTLLVALAALALTPAATLATPVDLRSPDTRDAAIRNQAALAQERYYSSSTRSVPQPLATAGPARDGIAPLTFTVAIVAAVIVGLAAGSGLQVAHTRRRHTTGLAT